MRGMFEHQHGGHHTAVDGIPVGCALSHNKPPTEEDNLGNVIRGHLGADTEGLHSDHEQADDPPDAHLRRRKAVMARISILPKKWREVLLIPRRVSEHFDPRTLQ